MLVWASSHAICVFVETSGNCNGIFVGFSPLGILLSLRHFSRFLWLFLALTTAFANFRMILNHGTLNSDMQCTVSAGSCVMLALSVGGGACFLDVMFVTSQTVAVAAGHWLPGVLSVFSPCLWRFLSGSIALMAVVCHCRVSGI